MADEQIPVLSFNDNATFSDSAAVVFNSYPPAALTFGNGASISWENGTLTFKGDMDEAAKMFFECFLKDYVDSYIKATVPHNNLKYLEWCAMQKERKC